VGKKKGKIFASIFGFALGFANPAFFGAGTASFTAGMYGASLASNLWSMSHKPKVTQDYGRFDSLMNTISSEAMIPIIYGRRKWAGNQTYHKPSADKKKLVKDVVLCEGEIEWIEYVAANDMPIYDTPIVKIKYTGAAEKATYSVKNSIFSLNFYHLVDMDGSMEWTEYGSGLFGGSNPYPPLTFDMIDKQPIDLYNWLNQQVGFQAIELVSYFALSTIPDKAKSASNTDFKNVFGSLIIPGLPGCSYEFHNGSPAQQPPSNYADVGSYKNMAWLRVTLTLSEKLQGSNPTITCVVYGKKVNVYRNGAWYYEYSDNPVWCVRDYCLSRRYGLGRWFTASDFDNDANLESADYCNAAVSYKDENGVIRQEKRYSLNIILDQKRDAVDQLSDMLCNFAGYFSFSPYSVAIRIEKETSKSYDFTDATIITDSVKFGQKPSDENFNRYTVGYFDPNNNWTQVKVLLEDFPGQKQSGKVVNSDVTFPGTLSQSQALRLTRLLKDVTKLCSINMSFQTATMAMHLQCGDVVHVTYKNYFTAMPFRIQAIDENNGIWTLTCRQYNGSIYNDQLGAEIQVKNYNFIASPLVGVIPEVSGLTLSQTYYRQGDGTIISDIGISFNTASYQFLRQYIVDYSIDNGVNWTNYVNTLDNQVVLHNAIVKKTYLIRVRVQNTAGRVSGGLVSDSLFVTGKDNPPSDVTRLSVSQIDDKLHVAIIPNTDPDLRHYELRLGVTWEESEKVTIFYDQLITIDAPREGTLTYLVKAVDNSGNQSTNATKSVVNVFNLPIKNVIAQREEILSSWSNTDDKCFLDGTQQWQLNSKKTLGEFALFADFFNSQFEKNDNAELILPVVDLGQNIIEEGFFFVDGLGNVQINSIEILGSFVLFSEWFNAALTPQPVKYVTQTFIKFDVIYSKSINTELTIEYRTSIDGQHFGSWTPISIRQFFGRYVQIRILPKTLNGITQIVISSATQAIDVPDVENIVVNKDIPAQKTRIVFNRKFYATPKSLAVYTQDTTGKWASNRTTNITNDGFDLEILDGDTLVAGKMQEARARGY
jgi:hypothetical protein